MLNTLSGIGLGLVHSLIILSIVHPFPSSGFDDSTGVWHVGQKLHPVGILEPQTLHFILYS